MLSALIGDKVVVENEATASKLQQKGFGRPREGKLELSLLEAAYLLERGSIKVLEGEKECSHEDLLQRLEDEDALLKYRIYRDLRQRGYIVKTGFKFGAHFRVYERGDGMKEHSRYLVHAVRESETMEFPELARAVRLAHSVKKTMVFAVMDQEGDITYYKIERMTP
jgi:tRNA-intron endonuclease